MAAENGCGLLAYCNDCGGALMRAPPTWPGLIRELDLYVH